jgi:predicted porin
MTTFTGAVGNYRDQAARYTSPRFSNTTVSFGLLKKSSDSVTGGAVTEDTTGYDLGLRYAAGPLSVGAAYRSADSKANGSAAVAGVAGYCADVSAGTFIAATALETCATVAGGHALDFRVSGSNAVAAGTRTDTTMNTTALGASYNFGSFVGFAQYFEQEDKNNVTTSSSTDAKAYALGVRVPMGKSTLFASYTDGEVSKTASSKTDVQGMQLGVKYDLSKRTSAYVAYGEKEEQATGADKSKAENLAVGVFHTF